MHSDNLPPIVSVVIPTRNRRNKLVRCVDSVLESTLNELEVIVVDDASDYDVSADFLERDRVSVIRNSSRKLLSYSRNVGAEAATGEFLFFVDDDNVVAPTTIAALVETLKSDKALGVCSPVIYFYEEPTKVWTSDIQKGRFPGFYLLGTQKPEKVSTTFSFHNAFMISRPLFELLGGFDPVHFPIHFSELDLAYRVRASNHVAVVNPAASVWHDVGRAHMHVDRVRAYYTVRNRVILLKKYEPARTYRVYILCVLPGLVLYYSSHHFRNTDGDKLRTAFSVVRGAVAGIAFPVRPFRVPTPAAISAPRANDRGRTPLVTVIIPTKNSASTVAECISSVRGQTYPNLEIVLVDNFSTDGTVAIAKQSGAVKVFIGGDERSAQVNLGARMAGGEYLYRVDSDFVLEPAVVEQCVERCEVDGFKVVTVHNTSDPRNGFWARVRKLERDCYVDDDAHVAARFFSREVFDTVGGFDELLFASEDYDLHNKLVAAGFKIGRIQAKECHLGEPRSLKEVVRKHIYYGENIRGFIKKTPRSVWTRELNPVRLAYFRHWRSFLRDPKVSAGFLFYQYVKYASAFAGYLSSFL